ncbi:YitT family protein [Aquibacillus koreensis]|uniref:YitT family protein n=2 Tax=Aquibacillus koreensis TaxID=279446 RepID=A0A9X3WKT1_9BACI|nr:YitT family protein [Aquibacillus koreensis]MCT2537658.1 YitT family protein [Aquibacillus koreensis]MDC3419104.1 YitT family protein [Aquibacillus koreensis]
MTNLREHTIRWFFFFFGLIVLSLGVTLTIKASDLGIGPWDVFHYGLFLKFGLTIGTWSIIAGVVIVFFTSLITRSRPQLGTYLNMVLIGVFIDIFNWMLPDVHTIWIEILLLTIGIIVAAIGIGLYVAPKLGAGPRDGLMLYLSSQFGWKVSNVRNGIELIVFLLGWLLGGPVGIGTIIIVITLGNVIGYTIPKAEQMLDYVIKRGAVNEDLNQRPIWANHYD